MAIEIHNVLFVIVCLSTCTISNSFVTPSALPLQIASHHSSFITNTASNYDKNKNSSKQKSLPPLHGGQQQQQQQQQRIGGKSIISSLLTKRKPLKRELSFFSSYLEKSILTKMISTVLDVVLCRRPSQLENNAVENNNKTDGADINIARPFVVLPKQRFRPHSRCLQQLSEWSLVKRKTRTTHSNHNNNNKNKGKYYVYGDDLQTLRKWVLTLREELEYERGTSSSNYDKIEFIESLIFKVLQRDEEYNVYSSSILLSDDEYDGNIIDYHDNSDNILIQNEIQSFLFQEQQQKEKSKNNIQISSSDNNDDDDTTSSIHSITTSSTNSKKNRNHIIKCMKVTESLQKDHKIITSETDSSLIFHNDNTSTSSSNANDNNDDTSGDISMRSYNNIVGCFE